MMKKIAPLLLIVILAFWARGYFLGQNVGEDHRDHDKHLAKAQKNSFSSVQKSKSSLNLTKNQGGNDETNLAVNIDKKNSVQEIELSERKWQEQIKKVFTKEQDYHDYQAMQEAFAEDMSELYEGQLENERKEKKSFHISDLDDGAFRKLQDDYLKAFQKRFGQNIFIQYLKEREEFNDSDPALEIEF